MDTSKRSLGITLCIAATVSWGGMFPIMTHALRHIDPFTFTCMRYTIAGAMFLLLLVRLEGGAALRLTGERVWLAWAFGTAGFAGFQFLVFYGQKLIGVGGELVTSIMMATMPMLGFFVNWFLKKVAPPKWAALFILMSLTGVLLVVSKGNVVSLLHQPKIYGPAALILFAALCWVIYTAGAGFFPTWSPYRYTALTTLMGLGSAMVITLGLLVGHAVAVPTGGDVVSILPELAYMGVVAGFGGVLCWNIGNKILTPLNGVLFMDVVPITAFTITALTGTVPVAAQLVGAGLTATALLCNNVYLRHRLATPAATPEPAVVTAAAEPAASGAGAVSR